MTYRVLIPLARNPLILGPLLAAYERKALGSQGGHGRGRPRRYISAEERGLESRVRVYGPLLTL